MTLMGHVTMGEHNHLFPGVVIGGEPQDVSYRGSDTQVDHRRPQRHSRGRDDQSRHAKKKKASPRSATTTFSWPAATWPTIAGWAATSSWPTARCWAGTSTSTITPRSPAPSPCITMRSIGSYSFVGGLSRVLHDVPPFMLVEGHPARPRCINVVALKRNNFSPEAIELPGRGPSPALSGQGRPRPRPRDPSRQRPARAASERAAELRPSAARGQARPGPRTQESRM